MTPTPLEHLITAALHDHAEETMSRTDTESGLHEMLDLGAKASHRRHRQWAAGGLVAAALVVSGAVLWPTGHEPDSAKGPTPPTTSTEPMNADEQLAHDFVTAYATFDRTLATSFLGDGVTLSLSRAWGNKGWLRQNRWDEAMGAEMTIEGCFETETLSPGGTQVGCLFSYDILGLDELGRGPFPGNLFTVTVRDGKVVDFVESPGANDYDEVAWNPFWAWVESERAAEVPALEKVDEPDLKPKEVARVIRLWEQVGQEYVAALRAGAAD
jgi:hypothetical protein